jgi:predicted Rossmann fold nucleotide-binding protein DprA/Smf involved in DNA uptake
MAINDITYLVTLYHSGLKTKIINNILIKITEQKIWLWEFFNSDFQKINWLQLANEDIETLIKFKERLPNCSFFIDNLLKQWYNIISFFSKDYPKTLKKNLWDKAPAIIYTKWNIQLLNEESIAIVWSRNANDISLQFTDNISKLATKNKKIVISGFAKWVDRQALGSTVAYWWKSIIVLPQGVRTFSSWFKQYYKDIAAWNVLVISTFHPDAPRSTWFAMARNTTIYWLTNEIYVSESSEKWWTWSWATNWLKKWYKVHVRNTDKKEKNANKLLIEQWWIPVDLEWNILDNVQSQIINKQKRLFE